MEEVKRLEFGFELAKAILELPLLLGFGAGVEEGRARGGGFVGAEGVVGAGGCGLREFIGRGPKALAREECVLYTGAD